MTESQQKIVEDNMKLVYHVVRTHYPTYIANEDIIQEGMLGLCRAVTTFDESQGKFSSYAGICITNQIRSWFKRNEKHNEVLSLDSEMVVEDGEKVSYIDMIVGSDDVDFIDYSILDKLSDRERELFKLLYLGYNQKEIAEMWGMSYQMVSHIKRKLERRLRGKYGND